LALRHTSVLEQIDELMGCVPGFGSEMIRRLKVQIIERRSPASLTD